MTIVVEDGTNVTNANSYVTRAELIAFAALRGITILDTSAADVYLIQAMDYLESKRPDYVGDALTYDDQVLAWPRTYVYIDGLSVDDDEIPVLLKKAEMQLAVYAFQGVTLMPTVTDKFVISETVGPISTTYSEDHNTNSQPYLPLVDGYMRQLLRFGSSLQLVRV